MTWHWGKREVEVVQVNEIQCVQMHWIFIKYYFSCVPPILSWKSLCVIVIVSQKRPAVGVPDWLSERLPPFSSFCFGIVRSVSVFSWLNVQRGRKIKLYFLLLFLFSFFLSSYLPFAFFPLSQIICPIGFILPHVLKPNLTFVSSLLDSASFCIAQKHIYGPTAIFFTIADATNVRFCRFRISAQQPCYFNFRCATLIKIFCLLFGGATVTFYTTSYLSFPLSSLSFSSLV